MLRIRGDPGKGAHCTYFFVARCIALVGATERLLTCLLCWNRILLFRETALPGVGHSQRNGGRDGAGSRWGWIDRLTTPRSSTGYNGFPRRVGLLS